MEENMSSTQEKPRDRVMALPEKLRKELLYLAHLDPERQKSTLLHNVAVSGEKIQQLIDSAKREGAIEELELYVKYIENTDKFHPLYASLDRDTAIDECRKFASNYGKHRITQLEQSEESK